ncbi:MAG: heavy metal translocating P-type ATPase [Janthinobacterium lividum]
MSATVSGPLPGVPSRGGALLAAAERGLLGTRLLLAMVATGLLGLAVLWQFAFPDARLLADLVAGAAALLVAVPMLSAAWGSLRHPSLHGVTDRLVAVALVAAWAGGDLMTAAILPILMTFGHVLEERSLLGSREAIEALGRLTETEARRLDGDGVATVVPTASLRPGDRIELLPGARLPVDGTVMLGEASLDTASLTGESMPVEVKPGDAALAGSINTDGRLVLEVTRLGADTTLGKIIALMQTAENAKPPVARLLERYAGHYTALVLLLAAATWLATGNTAATLAVLVASCPCALVLAAPATAIAAIAVAARHGILIKGAAFLEQLAEVTSVVFDKTGTLTTGELTLLRIEPAPGTDPDASLRLAAALGSGSAHPVSRAAVRAAPPGPLPVLSRLREAGGFGVSGMLDGQDAALGRPGLLERMGVQPPPPPPHDGPVAGLALGGAFLGWLLFADQPRPEARAALTELRGMGLQRQMLLTGDRDGVARRIGAELGIVDVVSGALPQDKMDRVLAENRSGFCSMVVGDGINDSLALKAGAVGVAMGAQGTDVALAAADLVLMTSDLRRLGTAIRLSRRCRRTIHVNIAIGLGWTVLLVVLAAAGMLGTEGAVVAALLHNVSTFAGLGNAGRLLLFDETAAASPLTPSPT